MAPRKTTTQKHLGWSHQQKRPTPQSPTRRRHTLLVVRTTHVARPHPQLRLQPPTAPIPPQAASPPTTATPAPTEDAKPTASSTANATKNAAQATTTTNAQPSPAHNPIQPPQQPRPTRHHLLAIAPDRLPPRPGAPPTPLQISEGGGHA